MLRGTGSPGPERSPPGPRVAQAGDPDVRPEWAGLGAESGGALEAVLKGRERILLYRLETQCCPGRWEWQH